MKPIPHSVNLELAGLFKHPLTGEIRAQFESDLAFRVGGRNVDIGDHVVADKVLAKIDPNEQQANVSAAEADVQAADAK
jgi:multidrug efflux pump subunit AcrA (membrane-fusion protein)